MSSRTWQKLCDSICVTYLLQVLLTLNCGPEISSGEEKTVITFMLLISLILKLHECVVTKFSNHVFFLHFYVVYTCNVCQMCEK